MYLPRAAGAEAAADPYRPFLYGSAQLFFGDSKVAVEEARRVSVIVPLDADTRVIDWDRAEAIDAGPQDLLDRAPVEAPYAPLPPFATNAGKFSKLARDFDRWLGRTQRLELFHHAGMKMTSRPGESSSDFLIRVRDAAHEKRDAGVDRLRRKWDTRLTTARERVRRATTAARGVGRSMKERQQVGRAEDTLAADRQSLASLEALAEAEVAALAAESDVTPESVEQMAMRPRRGGTTVDLVAVVWQ